MPALFNQDLMDGSLIVTDEEAVKYMKLIGEKEGLYAVKLLESGLILEDWTQVQSCSINTQYDG